nr:hypothetical protein [Paenibacillus sp. HB172176]
MQQKELCEKHMHRYVMVQTNEGCCFDGIVEHVDDEMVCIAVPYCPGEWDGRAFFPYGGFGGFGGYGGFYPRRRFYRRAFPLGSLLALSLLPYYF